MNIIKQFRLVCLAMSFIMLYLQVLPVKAQSFWDLFNQQSKKRKLMAQQIAAYQLYLGEIDKGYNVVQNGLSAANRLKNGTFSLHYDYFNSLEQISPAVKKNTKGRIIDSLYRAAASLFAYEKQWQKKHKILTDDELRYYDRVVASLQKKARQDMHELEQLMTPGKLKFTDAERLAQLERIYDRIKDQYAFAGYFTTKCRKLAMSRQQDQRDRAGMKKLYGIN